MDYKPAVKHLSSTCCWRDWPAKEIGERNGQKGARVAISDCFPMHYFPVSPRPVVSIIFVPRRRYPLGLRCSNSRRSVKTAVRRPSPTSTSPPHWLRFSNSLPSLKRAVRHPTTNGRANKPTDQATFPKQPTNRSPNHHPPTDQTKHENTTSPRLEKENSIGSEGCAEHLNSCSFAYRERIRADAHWISINVCEEVLNS